MPKKWMLILHLAQFNLASIYSTVPIRLPTIISNQTPSLS